MKNKLIFGALFGVMVALSFQLMAFADRSAPDAKKKEAQSAFQKKMTDQKSQNYGGVVHQTGRVEVDSDFNEETAQNGDKTTIKPKEVRPIRPGNDEPKE